MKFVKNAVFFPLCLIFSQMVTAASSEWTDAFAIESIQTGSSGHVIVKPATTQSVNPAGCTNGSGSLYLLVDNSAYDSHMAFILSAFHAGSNIKLNVSGTSCNGAYREIIRVYLEK